MKQQIYIVIRNVTYGCEHPFQGAFARKSDAIKHLKTMLPSDATITRDGDQWDIEVDGEGWVGHFGIVTTTIRGK